MNQYGFIKVGAVSPYSKIADVNYNAKKIIELIEKAERNFCSVVVFPELSLTAYTCQDLFLGKTLQDDALQGLIKIKEETRFLSIISIVGFPMAFGNTLYNCAAILSKGKILGIVPKIHLPNYREFYELRWFDSGDKIVNDEVVIDQEKVPFGNNIIFKNKTSALFSFGIEICEDLWCPFPPSSFLAERGANLVFNLSASNTTAGKKNYRRKLVETQSTRLNVGYIYCNAAPSESTTDIVFDGDCFIFENGELLAESEPFLMGQDQIIFAEVDLEKLNSERIQNNNIKNDREGKIVEFQLENRDFPLQRIFSPYPFIPAQKNELEERCEEIFSIQSVGLARRLETLQKTKAIIGLSGGLDSTLALLVTLRAMQILKMDKKDFLIPVTMPGFGTTNTTLEAVKELCQKLEISFLREIEIKKLSEQMFELIQHKSEEHDTTYENVQARARTYLLMSIANQENGIVIGTGDLSEAALGWSTYNGDHISMYNVNSCVPKTLIRFLIQHEAQKSENILIRSILEKIIHFPISPELLPSDRLEKEILQRTEEKIGPYELHDYFLYYFVRFGFRFQKLLYLAERSFSGKYTKEEIKKWLSVFIQRFFTNQWKRDCVPAGPKVGSVDLSPRGAWRMSCESDYKAFLKE